MQTNVLNFFEMDDFCQIFVIFQNIEILIESNYWLRMYILYIFRAV